MPSAGLLSYTPPASTIITPSNLNPNQAQLTFLFCSPSPPPRSLHHGSLYKSCRASSSSSSSSSSSITDFDLYDLLGIDSTSNLSQIKDAYRSLQKRCHPDIAGPAGHDMAIILNEAYAVLSDSNSRFIYDKEQSKMEEFRGYTGKPLYSTWFGSETEERAVFVDELKCVGCLKCALLAQKTFAIESAYGRARVVGQWADPEDTIQEAIEACPVNCIWTVERSNLAALEFLMSKQPRGNVRMSIGNTGGTRVADVLTDVEKFQSRYVDAKRKAAKSDSKDSDLQREARMSAIHSIRSFSNWWYWTSPKDAGELETCRNLIPVTKKSTTLPGTAKLREAVAAKKQAATEKIGSSLSNSSYSLNHDEYWKPSPLILPAATTTDQSSDSNSTSGPRPKTRTKVNEEEEKYEADYRRDPIRWRIPVAMATVGAVIVRWQLGDQGSSGSGGLKDHIGGSMVLEIVNSSWLQVTLAGVTWYLIGMAMVELVDALRIMGKNAGNRSER
ncbi:chaperone protein dnaJ C76, chloroplastic [Macadamia integrifolia]|uniref:chaperone protein dnaJ C76, chloroplastic n=1 Tax=Macadamia integrifolia TaxID=60698 RepID=UPI001C4F9703|nr:chaperone protein dnaJ C76, chloroplastic [Macadamia integrifolia]